MGTEDTKGPTTTIEDQQTKEGTQHQEDNKVSNLQDYKLKRLSDEDLVNECLLSLRAIELGLISTEHKIRSTQLFNEAILRKSLAYIADDFRVALRVLKHL